jgi:anti-sigma factor (TIGR02949 family)
MKKVSTIPCETALARLWAYIDGDLQPASEAEVKAHLEVCQRCYPLFDFQHAYFRLITRIADRPSPPGLRSATLDYLRKTG